MTKKDREKLIRYFEKIESTEGNGMSLSLGMMASDVHYENGIVRAGTDGVAFIDFVFKDNRRRTVATVAG